MKTCSACKQSERVDNPNGDGFCHSPRIYYFELKRGNTPHEVYGVQLTLPHNCPFFEALDKR